MGSLHINPVFIGHGSPMNVIKHSRYTNFLADYARSISRPKAILVISAHWQTDGSRITAGAKPEQIYDFYGFPDELYAVRYAPPGDPDLAREIAREIPEIACDETRGIDHAGWAVVKHLYPPADVPLLELSLDYNRSEREHHALGKKLMGLCDRGILVIGSGNVVHNLREIDFDDEARPFSWAARADKWIGDRILGDGVNELIEYKACMPGWSQAIPTDEHFLPLLYILGMRAEGGPMRTLYDEIQNGSIAMRSVACV